MDKKKKVLIISEHFPPLNSMASKRYGIMGKYLEEYQYRPYVITAKPKKGCFFSAKLDLDVPFDEKSILRIGETSSNYPIHNLAVMLVLDFFEKRNWESRVINMSYGWYEKVRQEVDLQQYKDVDVVIGTYPSSCNVFIAKYIAKKLGKPLVIEIRDMISDYRESENGRKRTLLTDRFLERIIMGNAAGIVAVTKGFERILRKRYPHIRTITVYNGWENKGECNCSNRSETKKKYLYYAGSLYEHRLESLMLLFHAMSGMDSKEVVEVRIRSVGPENLDFKLKRRISELGLEHIVKVLKAEKEEVIREEQEGAFINLVLSSAHREDRALMSTVPGKVFELLHQKPPILAIVPSESEIGEILRRTNKGAAAIDEKEILDFIKYTYNQYTGNEMVSYFSRKHQTKKLCSFLDQVIGRVNG